MLNDEQVPMNTLRALVQISHVAVTLAACGANTLASGSPAQPPTDAINLLDENPRLRQLIAEANRNSGPEEIERLTGAGVDVGVVQKYVETSSRRYTLDADEIIKLHKQGVAPSVITAMIRKKGNVETQSPAPASASAIVVQPVTVQSTSPASEPTSSVIHVPNSSRPVRYPDRPFHYAAAYPYASWSPAYYGGYNGYSYCPSYCFRPGYWNYRPTWSYDFRSSGWW